MSDEPRDLAQEALDLADGKKVDAALPRNRGYRRVSTTWLREVAGGLRDAAYREHMLRLSLAYCPPIDPCPDCGFPRMEGYPCDFCPPARPDPDPEWRVEVTWNVDHGWLIEVPREDDGGMEYWDPPREWVAGDEITHREAVEWARHVARERGLPVRIYHKTGKVTNLPRQKP